MRKRKRIKRLAGVQFREIAQGQRAQLKLFSFLGGRQKQASHEAL